MGTQQWDCKQAKLFHPFMYVRTYVCMLCIVLYIVLSCHLLSRHAMRCNGKECNAIYECILLYTYIYTYHIDYIYILRNANTTTTPIVPVFFLVHWVSLPPTFSAPSSLAARLTSVVRVRAMVFSSLHWSFVTSCQRTTSVESIGSPKKIEQIQLKW